MADHAPGMGPATKEPSCINCGGIGHWAVACPEPARAKPAGLSRRNTSNGPEYGRGGDHQHGGRRSGPVVTKYSTPHGGNPIVTRYAPPPSQPPYPGPPQPYSSYPPAPGNYPPPPPPASYPGYSQYPPPPPPPPGPPATPTPYQYSAPGQYGGPPPPVPPGPPPPNYQSPHYPPTYPHPPSYTPPGYQPGLPPPPPHISHYPQPGGYPQAPYGQPPSQSPFGSQPPPPPPYPHPYGSHSQGFGPSPPLPGPPHSSPPHGLPPIPPQPQRNLPPRDRHNRHRQGQHNRQDRSRRQKNDNQPKRDSSQPRPKSGNKHDTTATRPDSTPITAETVSVASGTPETRQAPIASEHVGEEEQDWEWEEEMIFKEKSETHQPDPIAKPLPGPENYHDNIMLPPAWDAPCILSEFVTMDNFDEFSRPIRETEYFAAMRHDPAFWKPREPGAAKPPQPVMKERPVAFKSTRLPGFPSLPPRPPTPENRDHRLLNNRKRMWEDSANRQSRGQEGEWRDSRHKRPRADSFAENDSMSPKNRRAEDLRSVDRYRVPRSERDDHGPIEHLVVDGSKDTKGYRGGREDVAARQDSGYHSSRHMPRQDSSNTVHGRAMTTTPPASGTSPIEDRPQNKKESRERSRRRSNSSHTELRPASRQSMASNASHGDSDLSDLEAELLGMPVKSKGGKEGKQGDVSTLKFRKRAPRVDSAYSRRW